MNPIRTAILRTLAFNAAWGYAPTRLQLVLCLDAGREGLQADTASVWIELDQLISEGLVIERQAHVALVAYADQIEKGREKELYFPRKLRRARLAAWYLSRLPWVRAVCLCNTVALGQARDQGDLDFFIVAKAGSLWRTRFFATLPFKIIGARPSSVVLNADPICLSFFVADDTLDLSRFMLPPDDPYFRYWFLSLLPLYEDGVLKELWERNSAWRARHPLARPWMTLDGDDFPKVSKKGTAISSWLEKKLEEFQQRRFPKAISDLANRDSRVVADEHVLKFHVDDQRENYRQKYYAICQEYSMEA